MKMRENLGAEAYAKWMAARTTHGAYSGGKESAEHYIWRSMHARCKNPRAGSYKSYGARGIRVAKRWDDFTLFLQDMGSRPSPAHSLDRKNVNGNYQKSNCRWATAEEQRRNMRCSKVYSNGKFRGVLVDCAAHLGISKELAHWRWATWGTFEKGKKWRLLKKP